MTTPAAADTEPVDKVDKPWRLQLSSDTRLLLPQPLGFVLGKLEIRVLQRSIVARQPAINSLDLEDVVRHVGVRFDVRTPAGEWQPLLTHAIAACSAISQLLAVVHRTPVTRPRFEGMIDLLPGNGPRILLQCISLMDAPSVQSPQFDAAFMVEFFQHWKSARDPDAEVQVNRALSHLQSSYDAEDAVTQFSELWIGMAALNELLKHEFGAEAIPVTCSHCKMATLYCSTCGEQHVQEHRETAVVRGIIQDRLGRPREEWKKINKLRQRVVHGIGVAPGQAEAVEAVAIMRAALALAVTLVLDLPADRASLLAPQRVPVKGDDDLWALTRIDTLPLTELANSDSIPEVRNVTGACGVMLYPEKLAAGRVVVPFAMFGYRGTCAVLEFFVQPGSSLLEKIRPMFITGGAPGVGPYHPPS